MEQFNTAFDEFNSSTEQSLSDDPIQIFNTLYEELVNRFDLLNNFDKLDEIKRHLYARIESSPLDEQLKNYYQNAIEDLDDYPMLFLFLEQQIQGA